MVIPFAPSLSDSERESVSIILNRGHNLRVDRSLP